MSSMRVISVWIESRSIGRDEGLVQLLDALVRDHVALVLDRLDAPRLLDRVRAILARRSSSALHPSRILSAICSK